MTPEEKVRQLLSQGGQCCTERCIDHKKVLAALKEIRNEALEDAARCVEQNCMSVTASIVSERVRALKVSK